MSSDKKIVPWTAEKLAGMPVGERHKLWKRARVNGTPEGDELAQMIEQLGLPFSDDACLKMDDPITIKMWQIINSPEGKAACLAAHANGQPAVAGVDPMLNEALGVDYRGDNMATTTAGSLVGELMRAQGYVPARQITMPPGCVAKSGTLWRAR